MSLLQTIKSWFSSPQPLSQEMLHYQTPPDAEQQYRLHLRVEQDGRGLLVVNAATILHLNQTATEYARLIIQGVDEEEAVRTITRRYHIGVAVSRADYRRLRDHIVTLATSVDLCPVTYLELERVEPFSADSAAPYRVDLALTYRIEGGGLDPEAHRRVDREFSAQEWQQVLEHLWKVGVPHVVFTGGEPTLRKELVGLVQHAENLGMVTGLLTDGRRLREWAYLERLLLAGLDHIQITLASHIPELHDRLVGQSGNWEETTTGLRNALAGDIYVVVHVVVDRENSDTIEATIAYLAGLGVPAVALSSPLRTASEEDRQHLHVALESAQQAAHEHELALIWDLAAPYSQVNPIELEAGLTPEQVIRQHLYIEPDGDVLPAQGYNIVLGNILRDSWKGIWEHPGRKR